MLLPCPGVRGSAKTERTFTRPALYVIRPFGPRFIVDRNGGGDKECHAEPDSEPLVERYHLDIALPAERRSDGG